MKRVLRKSRGLALVLALIVVSLLMVMLGAFLGANRAQLSALTAGSHQAAMERTAQSVYDYCRFKLEHNKSWGAAKFASTAQDSDTASALVVTEVENTNTIAGNSVRDGVDYTADIINNIEGVAMFKGVPAGSCRITIKVSRGGHDATQIAQLNTAPLYDASAVAAKGLTITGEGLTVASTDPNRNIIRSKEHLTAPDVADLDFTPATGSAEDGILWAGGDISLGTTNLSNDPVAKAAAIEATQGRFVDQAKTYYDIHDLKKSELRVAKEQVEIQSGLYVFTRQNIAYQGVDGISTDYVYALERREYTMVDGEPVAGDVQELWYYRGALDENEAGSGSEWVWTDNYSDGAVAHPVDTPHFSIQGMAVRADMRDQTLQISANVDVKVSGDFGLFSDQPDLAPNLIFTDYDGDLDGEHDRGSLSASGEILIKGNVRGSGKLLADGSVSIHPNHVRVESDTVSDLSIYSGNNVNIEPPENWIGTSDVSFTGLVYAKNDVKFVGAPNQSLNVEGAVVSQNGTINLTGKKVNLTYNPAYLDSIVKKMPDNRIRLERAVWIP